MQLKCGMKGGASMRACKFADGEILRFEDAMI